MPNGSQPGWLERSWSPNQGHMRSIGLLITNAPILARKATGPPCLSFGIKWRANKAISFLLSLIWVTLSIAICLQEQSKHCAAFCNPLRNFESNVLMMAVKVGPAA